MWPSGLECWFTCRGVPGVGSNPAGDVYFHFEFLLPSRSEQLSGSNVNEIKHDHSYELIVVLDPRYDKSYKALNTYSRRIAFSKITFIDLTCFSKTRKC